MKQLALSITAAAALLATASGALAQLQERPAIPREWYSEVVLWNYGENRPERYAAGCLRWGTHTRTWYDICKMRRDTILSVRY
jgi:hypothetical protein